MTLEELKDFHKRIISEYEEDSNWNPTTVKHQLTTLSGKVGKYLNYWTRLKYILIQIEEEFNEKYVIIYEHYKENSNISYTNAEIKDLISKNADLKNNRLKKSTVINIMEYLEKGVENLNRMRYDITNYIEIEKFLNGKS